MKSAGFDFKVVESNFDENGVIEEDARKRPLLLAEAKAREVASKLTEDAVVIGSDTVVLFEGRKFEKPIDMAEAFEMAKKLQGSISEVFTGVCILWLKNGKIVSKKSWVSNSKVKMKAIGDEQIRALHKELSPLDRAGGYCYTFLNSKGLVEVISGYESTVRGLPIEEVSIALKELGQMTSFF